MTSTEVRSASRASASALPSSAQPFTFLAAAPRLRAFHAEPSGDLVAHAGKSILEVIAEALLGLPVPVQLPGQAARGADHDVRCPRGSLYRTDDLGIRR